MSRALLPSWMADSQPGPGPARSERAEMAGQLARHTLVWDVTAAAAVAAGTGLIDAFGSHQGAVGGTCSSPPRWCSDGGGPPAPLP